MPKAHCPQPTNFVPGNSYQLSPNESASQARTCTSHSAARDFIQTRSPSPSHSVSKDAVPHGLSAFGTSVGPASHEANSGLAETLSSSTFLESRMPPCQGVAALAPLENHEWMKRGVPLGKLNIGADMLSQSTVPSDEWTHHPQTVQEIWGIFGRPEVDLFPSEDNTHCQNYFSKGRDALPHDWPNLLL